MPQRMSRNRRRGRRPRRPFRVMTNDVGYTLTPFNHVARAGKASASHLRCTNPSVTALWAATATLSGEPRGWGAGEPTLSVDQRRAGVEARPYGGLGRFTGNVVATYQRRPQPLSHGPSRRDSSPFRGAEGWVRFKHLVRSPTPDGRERAKRTGPQTGPFCLLKWPLSPFQTDSISLV